MDGRIGASSAFDPWWVTRSGRRLVCQRGRWTGATGGYAYRWSAGRKRGRTLRITRGLRGRTVRCIVTASNAAGDTTAASPPLCPLMLAPS